VNMKCCTVFRGATMSCESLGSCACAYENSNPPGVFGKHSSQVGLAPVPNIAELRLKAVGWVTYPSRCSLQLVQCHETSSHDIVTL
jgi:hypothetical protein